MDNNIDSGDRSIPYHNRFFFFIDLVEIIQTNDC